MKSLFLIPVSAFLLSCGPTYIYKPNGVPVISCRDLSSSQSPMPPESISQCITRNQPHLLEIYRYELKDSKELEESFSVSACVSNSGQAKVRSDSAPAKSQLEKFVRSYIELMEFPKSSSGACFKLPLKFILPKEGA